MPTPGPTAPLKEWDPARRRVLWLEVAVVVGIAVFPDLVNAICFALRPSRFPAPDIVGQTLGITDRSVRVGLAVLWIMWRSGDGWAEFGLTRVRPVRDVLWGLLIWLVVGAMFYSLSRGGGSNPFGFRAVPETGQLFAQPQDLLGWLLICIMAIANGFVEELAMCGFLIPRMERLWGTTLGAVALSAGLSASYHLYGGPWSVINAGLSALACGMFFTATRRIWPVVFAHILGDIMPFVFN